MNSAGESEITTWFQDLQDRICSGLEQFDGKGKFREDRWVRPGGGGGRSRVIEDGDLISKGGVNFSAVHGDTPPAFAAIVESDQASTFFATGVSIVLHPANPWVPIIHMNVRYFSLNNQTWWFGGGIDLTPHYVIPEDAQFFHKSLQEVCGEFPFVNYQEFKNWADEYFFISHRGETRGVGGIFFDKLFNKGPGGKDQCFEFVKSVGDAFLPVYVEIAGRRRKERYSDSNLHWQNLRRGRYAEFNLVYDRGTRFGLETSGRTESILMSLPPLAEWKYNFQPEPGSTEDKTLTYLRKGIDWSDWKKG